ncbi:MAG: hypothetical protein IPH45_20955 [Bacteroidales bacterium]|nr:hypothetical protein [Bacteroidales bacterium]
MKKLLLILMALFLWAGSSWGKRSSERVLPIPTDQVLTRLRGITITRTSSSSTLATELRAAGMTSGAIINSWGFPSLNLRYLSITPFKWEYNSYYSLGYNRTGNS